MRLLLDANLPRQLVALLRTAGWDAARVTEYLSATALDPEILHLAEQRRAVIVTRDQDFSFLASRPGVVGPTVISLRLDVAEVEALARILDGVLRRHGPDIEHGAILSVSERGVRVRRLPVR